MAKHFIFNTETGHLERIADTDAKKDNFVTGQSIYTVKSASDTDYAAVKNNTKIVVLVNGSASISDVSYEYPSDLADVKAHIKEFISVTKANWESLSKDNISDVLSALDGLDVDALTAAPSVSPHNWMLSQSGFPQKVWFEL